MSNKNQQKTVLNKQNKPAQSKSTKPNIQKQKNIINSKQKNLIRQQQELSVKQGDYLQLLDQNALLEYFKSVKITSVAQKKSDFYAYQRFINVTQQIYNGDLQVSQNSENINPYLVKQKISEEEEKSNQLKAKKMEILAQLSLLDGQVSKNTRNKNTSIAKGYNAKSYSMDTSRINSLQNQEQSQGLAQSKIGKLILSKKQHKQLVIKLMVQRQQRQKAKIEIKQKQQQKLKRIQEQQKKLENDKKQQQKRRKLQQIQEKLKKKRQMHEKFIEQQKESDKKVKQLKNKKFLHQQIEQRFQLKIKLPLLEEQKKILRQKRQFAKAYSIQQIKNHEKSYIQLRQSSIQKSQAKQFIKSTDPIKVPRSSKLQKILEQEKLQRRKKLMQKKMAIQQKIQRQQNYVQFLKQKFSNIKIDKAKQQQIKARIQKQTRRRQPEVDFKKIGMGYLSQAKRLRKKTTPRTSNQTQKQQNIAQQNANITALSEQSKKEHKLSRVSDDERHNNLLKKRQQKIQILIQDNSYNQTQRIRRLKQQTQKINEAFRMKQQMLKYGYSEKVQDEAVELLLTSIQAKMGIIDISK